MTQAQVQNTLLAASLKVANLVLVNYTSLTGGALSVQWGYINYMQRAINCVQRQYNLADYVSVPFIKAYDKLLQLVGTLGIGAINPFAQGGAIGQINITVSGSMVNTTIITFVNATTVILSNYNTVYAPTYGKTPLVCQIYVSDGMGGFTPDYTTSPDYVYVTSGVPSSGIVSITWTYAIPTTGFILLSGVQNS